MMQTRHPEITVDLSAILWNIHEIKKITRSAKLAPVVKADAYGHGAVKVARKIESEVDYFCVATTDEALELRESGIRIPVIIMGGFQKEEATEILENRFIPFVFEEHQIVWLEEAGKKLNSKADFILKFDTGMGRLGFFPSQAEKIKNMLKTFKHVNTAGLASHFAYSDLADEEFIHFQIAEFKKTIEVFSSEDYQLKIISIANSAGTIFLPESHFSMVRPGIAIYGINPAPHKSLPVKLKPAMEISARVLSVKNFPPGKGISYSHTYVTKKNTKIAVIGMGYADGLMRHLSNKGEVIIRGKKCQVVGNICMDLTMVDVTHVPGVKPGDKVVILGEMGGEKISAEEIAEKAGTISYEVLAGMSRKLKKRWVEN